MMISKGKITQVVAIQEYIYNKLTNVNMAIKQGKAIAVPIPVLRRNSTKFWRNAFPYLKNPQVCSSS